MARIPIVRRADPVAAPGFKMVSPEAFGAGVGQVLERAGHRMMAEDMEAKRYEAARQLDAEQAAAAKGVAEFDADFSKYLIEARKAAPAGAEGYAETAKAEFDKRRSTFLSAIRRPEVRSWAEGRLASMGSRYDVQETGWAATQRATQLTSDFASAVDVAANTLNVQPDPQALADAMVTQLSALDALDVGQDVKAKMKGLVQNRLARSYIEGLAREHPYEARDVLQSGTLNRWLDADGLTTISNGVDAKIRASEAAARAEAAAARREAREAERVRKETILGQLSDLDALLDAGVPVPPDTIAEAAAAARSIDRPGMSTRIRVQGLKNEVAHEWQGAPPAAIQSRLNTLEAKAAREGENVDAATLIERDQLRSMLSSANTAIRQDPLSYAARGGVALPELDPADPATFRARADAAKGVAARYGTGLAVLTDEEAANYAARWNEGNGATRTEILQEFRRFPGAAATAALRQIAGKNPLLAHAATLLGGPSGVEKARDIIAGVEALKADPKLAPKAEADEELAVHIGGALARLPSLRRALGDASRALYAARVARSGGGWDADTFGVAVDAALGAARWNDGVRRGGIGEVRGDAVLLPTDMSEDELADAISGASAADFARAGGGVPKWSNGADVAETALRNAHLQAVGDGRYLLSPAGDGSVLVGADGAPFVLDVRKLRQ